jgi:putative endonuclease
MSCYLYILKCSDGSFYTGTTRASLEIRLAQHNDKIFGGYTASRTPVELVYSEHFAEITDAIASERQIKGWSRAKKQALIDQRFDKLPELAKRRQEFS